MHIDIAPETERLVRDEINSGHFRSVDEMIQAAVETWRERNADPARLIGEAILDNQQQEPRSGMVEENGLLVYRTGNPLPTRVVDEAIQRSREARSLHLISSLP